MLVEHPKFNGRRTESGRTPHTLHWRLIAIQSLFCVCFIDRLIIFIREHIFLFKSYNHRPYAQEESIYCSTGFITINNILFCCWCRVQWVGEPLSGELDCVYLGVPLFYDIHMAHGRGRPVPHTIFNRYGMTDGIKLPFMCYKNTPHPHQSPVQSSSSANRQAGS